MNVKRLAIIAATGNQHKMREFRQIFAEVLGSHEDWQIDIFPEQELAEALGLPYEAPEEDGTEFSQNAMIKARGIFDFLKAHPEGLPKGYDATVILADDSGICVDALGGLPGVHSARYAQKEGQPGNSPDNENLAKLIADMEGVPDEKRTARFVCSIAALVLPEGRALLAEGKIEGRLTTKPFGESGFGYDPIFFVEKFGKTTAEMTACEKNAISHRGQALRKAAELFYGILTEV